MRSATGLVTFLLSFSLVGCEPSGVPVALRVTQPNVAEIYVHQDVNMQFVVVGKVDTVTLMRNGSAFAVLSAPYQYTFLVGQERDGASEFQLVASAKGQQVDGPRFTVHLDRQPPVFQQRSPAGTLLAPWSPIELSFDEPVRLSSVDVLENGVARAVRGVAVSSTPALLPADGAVWQLGAQLTLGSSVATDRAGNVGVLPLSLGSALRVMAWVDVTPATYSHPTSCAPLVALNGAVYVRGQDYSAGYSVWELRDGVSARHAPSPGGRVWFSHGALHAVSTHFSGSEAWGDSYEVQRFNGTTWEIVSTVSPTDPTQELAESCPDVVAIDASTDALAMRLYDCKGSGCSPVSVELFLRTDSTFQHVDPTPGGLSAGATLLPLAGQVAVVSGSTAWVRSPSGSWSVVAIAGSSQFFTTTAAWPGKGAVVSRTNSVVLVRSDLTTVALGALEGQMSSFAATADVLIAGSWSPGVVPKLTALVGDGDGGVSVALHVPDGIAGPQVAFDGQGHLVVGDTYSGDRQVWLLK